MDFITKYPIALAIVAVLAVIIVIWAKKEKKIQAGMLSHLTDEQKAFLQDNQVANYDANKFTWTQRGMIGEVTDKGSKVALKVLWFNTVIQNATLNDFQYADITMKKEDFNARGLSQGSIVTIFINPNKAKAEIV